MSKQTPATALVPAELYRLTPATLAKLRASLPPPLVDNSTSEHKAGFLLGIQYVLDVLDKGFTVGK